MDIYYIILVLPAFLFALYAQFKVKGTFRKYMNSRNMRGYTGAMVARKILDSNGLYDITVESIPGELTDHYDPRSRVVRLSEPVYASTSISAIGVAAHETGHAIQHNEGYSALSLRTRLVPIAGIGSSVGPYMAILGLMFNWSFFINLGIILFTGAVAFYLVTLPVELNASKRALTILETKGLLASNEIILTKKVLSAAAMTYVASAAVAMANLFRLILLNRRRNSNN